MKKTLATLVAAGLFVPTVALSQAPAPSTDTPAATEKNKKKGGRSDKTNQKRQEKTKQKK